MGNLDGWNGDYTIHLLSAGITNWSFISDKELVLFK